MGKASRSKRERRDSNDVDLTRWDEIPEEYHGAMQVAQGLKSMRVHDARSLDRGGGDIPPIVDFYRGGEPVAHVLCRQVEKTEMLQVTSIGIIGLAATEVFMTNEAYGTDQRFQEKYGRREILPGELQRLWQRGERDIVFEQLAITRGRRDRFTVDQMVWRYQIDPATRRITWQHPDLMLDDDPEVLSFGTIMNHVRDCFSRPPWDPSRETFSPDLLAKLREKEVDVPADIREHLESLIGDGNLAPEAFGLTHEEARVHLDIVVFRQLATAGFAVRAAVPPEYKELIQESMSNSNVVSMFDRDGTVRWEPPAGAKPTPLDWLNLQVGKKLEDDRNRAWLQEEHVFEAMSARLRRQAAEARKK